jgi:phosphoglycerate dehydrogenase-like enzyme
MNARPVVVVVDPLGAIEVEWEVLSPVAEVRCCQTTNETDLLRVSDADIFLIQDLRLTARVIERLEKCRCVVRTGVGTDNIDLRAAGERGIVVCNVPDYGTEEVADHALLLLLAGARRLMPSAAAIRDGGWHLPAVFGAPRLRGTTLGLIGCGRIGTAMARRGAVLGMRVVFYDPYQPDGHDKALGIERCYRLEELLAQARFLSLHCPLTGETRHILNARTLALLPKGAYVINTARGPCIDQHALVAALDSGQVGYAGLDVVEREPLDDDALRHHPNVLLTPHSAFYSLEGDRELRRKGAEEARRVLREEPVRNPVNRHCLIEPRCALAPRQSPAEDVLGGRLP